MRYIELSSGQAMPVLGQGTWGFGEGRSRRSGAIASLRYGLDVGLGLIDTAEMYGDGAAEEIVGEAIAGRRDEVFLVSKVYPHNASRPGVAAACERSLKRLQTDRLDLYLLHWRGSIPLAETVAGFEALMGQGKILSFGVSNFDTPDMEELWDTPGGSAATANQILYNPSRRGCEFDLLPWCRNHQVAVMAYSPIEQGRLLRDQVLQRLAAARGCTVAQLLIAWVLRREGVATIPKAERIEHVRENAAALNIVLTAEELAAIDHKFPPPRHKVPLEML
ncbi:MAG: oxidoreductase [Rhodospirillales bacterium]|jgi:diketogulonate reductase-like aldo/keto reductase|nr:oxidoreductase [Rhodospirillales bacterium]